ncbi:ATP-binding cassette domain-containing protein [Cyanobacterium aponinum UTEX 3221]|uniref:ATP-binding cassette domain-containing protein n=1 Tax=Cyanobacterium aponinum TaxID=379064 RepID=UPI002B4BF985|nr:ATP-binding cassette domain-containing protein [Cyanobacterium aponinum]WRL36913.1 ATP-binding cassette domain-containing protein [Cyanobacterium aponinum UTEX 3221]
MTEDNHDSIVINTDNPYIICSNHGQKLPPMELVKDQYLLGRDPNFVDFVVPNEWLVFSRIQATFVFIENHYHIFDGDRTSPSSNKLYINNHLITSDEGYILRHGDVIRIGNNVNAIATIEFYDPTRVTALPSMPESTILINESLVQSSTVMFDPNTPPEKIAVVGDKCSADVINLASKKEITIGRDKSCDVVLNAPTVSRKHVTIDYVTEGKCIVSNYSPNGIFVDGFPIKGRITINSGTVIKIVPYTFVFDKDKLLVADTGENIRLDAQNISLIVTNKKKEKIILLNNLSMPIEPKQLVALVGGSGAGKSTFLRTLLGIQNTTSGKVYLNGEDLAENFNLYRHQIGYVPQTDIIHKDLKVEEVLRFTAKLRLPPDIDIDTIIEKTLADIEMLEKRDVLVKNLSGGQLKRVSIGVELLVNPKLFFLDEPTSGLDPGLDKKIMQLLRKLADQGRTIILVTHATNNIKLCDRIAFLGQGGNLCFFGSYEEAKNFFDLENKDFADVYLELDNKTAVTQTAEKYQHSTYQRHNIENKLLTTNPVDKKKEKSKPIKGNFFRQLLVLSQRYLELVKRDRINLIISLLTAPIGIMLINLAAREREPFIIGTENDPSIAPFAQTVVFVFTCGALWVGLAGSLQEVVKEKDIYQRERLVNLNLRAYLGSKLLIIGALAIVQTLFMVSIALPSFASPEPEIISWWAGFAITSFLTLLSASCLGLMVSAMVTNITQANSALPILLLPQIIFSGVLFEIKGIIQYLSWLMISRWSVGAYGSLVDINGLIPEPTILPDGTTMPLPFEEKYIYQPDWDNLSANWQMLLIHACFYLLITYFLQRNKDIL